MPFLEPGGSVARIARIVRGREVVVKPPDMAQNNRALVAKTRMIAWPMPVWAEVSGIGSREAGRSGMQCDKRSLSTGRAGAATVRV